MPICSSGVSQPKSGVASSIVVDAPYIQSLLPAGLSWLYPYLPFMHGLQIGDVGAFCGADPPTWTVPSGADIFAFVTGGPISQVQTVNQFLQDITRAYLWYNICECASVATPAAPTAPTAPTGLPQLNPPGITGAQPGACGSVSGSGVYQTGHTWVDAIHNVLCGGGSDPSCDLSAVPVPTGAITARFTFTFSGTHAPTAGGNIVFVLSWFTSAFVHISNSFAFNIDQGSDTNFPYVGISTPITIPTNAAFVEVLASTGSFGPNTVQATVDFFCQNGTNINPGVQQCCTATDPLTNGTLQTILQTLTLIQRQIAPFAYITSTVHSGLTGTGNVAVSGILGLLANISAPSSTGLIAGTPDVRIPMGRVNLATADGYVDRHELVVESQLILPAAAGLFTSVGYSLEPGVTLTLTELVREP